MEKVTGVKSVDFTIKASGNGVVNFNGGTVVRGEKKVDGDTKTENIKNHTIPKLRGYTNKKEMVGADGKTFLGNKTADEINLKETPLYISQNCVRHHLFKDQSYDFHFATKKDSGKDPKKLLLSISGLVRGYVVPSTSMKRSSALLIQDFVDTLGNGNLEQFGNSGQKDSNSIFTSISFGDTAYESQGSISVEQLQFISLDKKFDREAIQIKSKKDGVALATELTELLVDMATGTDLAPEAEFGAYTRIGSIYNEPEVGILLNQDGIEVLVQTISEMLEDLAIRQAKGWMAVDEVEFDYNSSNKMMRIAKASSDVEPVKREEYAVYYKKVD